MAPIEDYAIIGDLHTTALNASREFVLRGQDPPRPLVGRGTDSRSGAATPRKHLVGKSEAHVPLVNTANHLSAPDRPRLRGGGR
jgi:hypothetical protein